MSRSRIELGAAMMAVGMALAGCSDLYHDRRDTISLSAGDAVKVNQMTQMIDPWPAHAANRDIAFNGEKMQSAVERYRTNRVIQPKNATTSSTEYKKEDAEAAAAALAPK